MRTVFITAGKSILSVAAVFALTFGLLVGYMFYPDCAGFLLHAFIRGEPAVRLLKMIYWSDLIFTLFHVLVPLCAVFLIFLLIRAIVRKRQRGGIARHWLHLLFAAVCWTVVSLGIIFFAAVSFVSGESLRYDFPVGFSHEKILTYREDLQLLKTASQTVTVLVENSEKWPSYAGGYYLPPSRPPRRPLFYSNQYGNGIKVPVELYIKTNMMSQYEISYLPNTKIAVSFKRIAPPPPAKNEWSYGYLRFPKSYGTAVTTTGETIKILGWESLSENQRRLFDLFLSGGLDEYADSPILTSIRADTVTPEEHYDVSFLFDLYHYSAYGYLPKYPYLSSGVRKTLFNHSSYYGRFLLKQPEKVKSLSEKAQEIISSIPPGLTQYETALWLAEYLVDKTEYRAGEFDQLAYGCLVEGTSVCAGYADAYAALLYRAGIPCAIMSKPTVHAWNLVLIDGQYRYVDTTWMDNETFCDYQYFMESYGSMHSRFVPSGDLAELERLLGLLAG